MIPLLSLKESKYIVKEKKMPKCITDNSRNFFRGKNCNEKNFDDENYSKKF